MSCDCGLTEDFSTLHGINPEVLNQTNKPLVFQIPNIQVVGFHLFDQGVTGIRTSFAQWPGGPLLDGFDFTQGVGHDAGRLVEGLHRNNPVAVTATSRLPRSAFSAL